MFCLYQYFWYLILRQSVIATGIFEDNNKHRNSMYWLIKCKIAGNSENIKNFNTCRKILSSENREKFLCIFYFKSDEEKDNLRIIITHVMNTIGLIYISKFDAYVKKAYIHRIKSFGKLIFNILVSRQKKNLRKTHAFVFVYKRYSLARWNLTQLIFRAVDCLLGCSKY